MDNLSWNSGLKSEINKFPEMLNIFSCIDHLDSVQKGPDRPLSAEMAEGEKSIRN